MNYSFELFIFKGRLFARIINIKFERKFTYQSIRLLFTLNGEMF